MSGAVETSSFQVGQKVMVPELAPGQRPGVITKIVGQEGAETVAEVHFEGEGESRLTVLRRGAATQFAPTPLELLDQVLSDIERSPIRLRRVTRVTLGFTQGSLEDVVETSKACDRGDLLGVIFALKKKLIEGAG